MKRMDRFESMSATNTIHSQANPDPAPVKMTHLSHTSLHIVSSHSPSPHSSSLYKKMK